MYAAGRIPGSFFRREGRPSEDAILTCRLIDLPPRPTFKKGLRNEVQVVETVLALDPSHPYDVVAINAASLSTQLSGLPFNGPIGGDPHRAHRRPVGGVPHPRGNWSARPSTWSSPAASRPTGDVAIMMVEAEATENVVALVPPGGATAPTEEIVASGLEASKPAILEYLCRAQSELAAVAAKAPTTEFPVFLEYQDDVFEAVEAAAKDDTAAALQHRRQAGARGAPRRDQGRRPREGRPASSRVARRRSARRSAR